jgi:hypothetical protein
VQEATTTANAIYNYATGAGTNKWAYQIDSNDAPEVSENSVTVLTAAQYTAIGASDDSRFTSNDAGGIFESGDYMSVRGTLYLNQVPSSLQQITLSWEGYVSRAGNVNLYARNQVAGTWTQVASAAAGTSGDSTISGTLSGVTWANYVTGANNQFIFLVQYMVVDGAFQTTTITTDYLGVNVQYNVLDIDHRWQFDMGSNPTFYIDASNPVGSDSTFKMQWSSNGGAAWNDFTTNIQYAAGELNVLKSSTIPLATYVDTFLVRAITINPGAVADTFSIDRMWATGQFNNNPENVRATVDISNWQPGEYQLYVYGWDKTPQYNRTSTAYATLIITDDLPPEIYNFLVNGAKHRTMNLTAATITLTGTVDDTLTGNSDIKWGAYAHQNKNYSIGEYMTNITALDSPVESFTKIVNISGWRAINNTLFMYGGDAVGMNNETSKENVTVNIIDNVAPATTPWSIKLNGGSECWVDPMVTTSVTITAIIDDALHGFSNIIAAKWAVGPANLTGIGMLPVGGSWNNYTKQVTGTINFATWLPGTYYIYVYGTDSKGNAQTVITSYAILYLDNNGPAIEGPWAGVPAQIVANPPTRYNPYIWVTATSFGIVAYGDDRARGRSVVVCAEYFVDTVGANGTGIAMANVGFRFDSPYEGAKATIACSGWVPGEFHTYYIHFKDAMGEWGDMGSVLVMKKGNDFILPIHLGWNLISLPLVTSSSNIRDILMGISWDRAYIYDPQNPNPWLSHGSARPTEINDFAAVDITMGIWVNVTSAAVNHVDISGGTPGITQITLHAGWNLVGYPSITNRLASVALAGTGADRIAIFDGASPTFMQDITDISTITMTAGNGYWVHVPADTIWTINP